MRTKEADVAVIGGGPAGLAAALAARAAGAGRVLIIERDRYLGGILQQCVHVGFGLHLFKEELSGPEYAHRFIECIAQDGIEVHLNTMVIELESGKVIAVGPSGLVSLQTKAVVLAMGCRERTRGNIGIPGSRPAGIFTAGTAQRFVNIEGFMPGRQVVILGSGDVGLIMARRLTLEGVQVRAVVEVMPYSNGLTRNVVQCLNDFGIPLLLQHTVVEIHGSERVNGVTIAQVDNSLRPEPGTERRIDCDTLLLSVGLIPENELSRRAGIEIDPLTSGPLVDETLETSVPGIFACGNVLHVHDVADYVSEEAALAGRSAAGYALGSLKQGTARVEVRPGANVRYVIPQRVDSSLADLEQLVFSFRVKEPARDVKVRLSGGQRVYERKESHVIPSEMIRLVLPRRLLAAQGLTGAAAFEIEVAAEVAT